MRYDPSSGLSRWRLEKGRMDINNRKILIGMVIITLLLFPAVAFTSGALRIALGLLFALFFPGYTLLSALFPRRDSLGGIERIALSFGLSIAVTPLIGLILNYTPWGISLYPILISVTIFILVTSAIAWYRQQRLSPAERFSVAVNISLPQWGKMRSMDKVLSISLVIAILAALGSLGYVIAIPKESERFTEFYILGIDGKAENYPKQVTQGETVELIVGIINHEREVASYRIDIEIDGSRVAQIRSKTLAHEQRWEEVVSFIPQNSGKNQKVEFWLYKEGKTEPHLKDPLHLYIDVGETPM